MPTMPNLFGLNYDAALAAMVAAGVRVVPLGYFQTDPVTIGWLKANSVAPGSVFNQVPAAGQSIAANAPVAITMASFPFGVSSDGPVQTDPLVSDVMLDGPDSVFILDESTLK